ncbi:hypothetical protein SELMODRAFT_418618 [Selaginella moellendorffii]|uniref:Uncharacterized protein n=1 Tax=Selaginella moellendorffii TaxID=88036 RepID=D8S6L6_SELML|nr:hypothetical protein SELMODRAFT_418618 [Selaginella moellendorffii]
MSCLFDGFLTLIKKILGFLSEGISLPIDYFEKCFGVPNESILMNYYPSCPEPEKDGIPSLQVLQNNTSLVVKPILGAITINISDLLEEVLECHPLWKVKALHPRMSITSNYICLFDSAIAPALELIDKEHPQLYKPVKCRDYVQEVVKRVQLKRLTCLSTTTPS